MQATAQSRYPVKLTVFCDDRAGMLKQITAVISDDNTNIRNIEAKTGREATIDNRATSPTSSTWTAS